MHRLVEIVFPLLVTVLFLLLLLAQPVASILVSFVLLLLTKNQEIKWSGDSLARMNAITPGFTNSVFADEAVIKLNVARLLFDLAKPSKIVETNLPPPLTSDWAEGTSIRS